ncbi:hypothetical protein [Maribacter sp. HTCC2170]|uniref:hypothetical protein n=1 Tax=Maribacter sp. (strain HTCC2170 / KCCM 42371) TaxID=313603 RepID=UPI00006BD2FE|nr:hypothetical protein [Maribacter sp. HTCC2170]EAR02676.1 hypothetical protein FB2170_05295 [Maribacter sp. HTCC2170]
MQRLFSFLIVLGLFSCSSDDGKDGIILKPDGQIEFLEEVEWVKSFGGSGEETAQAVISTIDDGYAILGYSNSTDGDIVGKSTAVNDYWLLKLDGSGNLEWNKTYGGSKDDRGQSLAQTNDGGYILTGYAMSDDGDGTNNEGFHDNWILKLDASGELEWERSFGFSGHDHSYDIIQTQDGGYFFIGFLDITAAKADGYTEKGRFLTRHGVGEFWGTKIDEQGNIQWRRYFGGTNNDRAHAVVQSNDGGFVMAGFSESDDFDISETKGSYDFWVVKITSSGDLVWERSFGGSGIEISYDIAKTLDNAYVITGNTFSDDADVTSNSGESDIWMIKIDDSGNLIWEKTYGGTQFDAAQGVSTCIDGGFLIAGNSKSSDFDTRSNNGENDLWVVKTNFNGDLIWQQTFGGADLDYGFDVLENADKSVIVVGESASIDFPNLQNKGMSDLIVIKIK